MVLPNFVKAALDGKPISVYGNGQQSRCFCDVRDTVEALTRLIDTPAPSAKSSTSATPKKFPSKPRSPRQAAHRSSSPIEFIPYDQAYEPGFEDMIVASPASKSCKA